MDPGANADASEVSRLIAAARQLDAPVAAFELQWELDDADDLCASWRLDLCAIVRGPGPLDSRFRSEVMASFPAEERAGRARADAVGRAVASAFGVVIAMPDLATVGGAFGSRWIERQGEAPAVDYTVRWALYTWTDDGERRDLEGERTVEARSGRAAETAVERALEERYRAKARPVFLSVAVKGEPRRGWMHHVPELAGDLPSADELRRLHLAGTSVGAIVRDLSAGPPPPSTLTVMMALERAFGLGLTHLGAVAAWRAGRLDLAGLDAALDPHVLATRPSWDRPRRLREARAHGASVAALLRREQGEGAGTLALVVALRETFGVALGDAHDLVERVGVDGDLAIDDALEAAIARARVVN